MTPTRGPAAAGPAALGALAAVVRAAEEDNAEGHPRRARRRLLAHLDRLAALDLGDPEAVRVRARGYMELAKSDFETRSGALEALAEVDAMIAAGAAETWPGVVPALAGVRGLLALRAGRSDEALAHLDAAIDAIDVADPVDGCRALLNRGVLHSERREVGPARADYTECARRARLAGFALLTFKAEHNLGYVHFHAGRLPQALAAMEEAGRSLPGPPRPTALRDRSDVLLEAGLIAVADATLAEAAAMFATERLRRDVAECELGRAECALLRGDVETARRFAESARRTFLRRGDGVWVQRASLLSLQADAAAFSALPPGPQANAAWAALSRRARRVEESCRVSGRRNWGDAAQYVRIEADLARGAVADPEALLESLGPVRRADALIFRLHGRRIRAMLALAAGEPRRASRYVRDGQRDLSMHRARFGSLDLRTAGAVHGGGLARLDMRLALDTGRPGNVLEAVERVRAVIGGTPRVNPPSDPETAALLTDLRRLVDENRRAPAKDVASPDRLRLLREAARLKHDILARSWHEKGRARDERPGTYADARRTIQRRPGSVLLDVVDHAGSLLAVRVDDDGARLVELGESAGVAELVRRVHADLEVVSNPLVPADLRAVADRSLAGALRRMDERLAPVLESERELVVVAGGWLGVLPWSMLPCRVGRATVVAPSVHHWMTYAGTARPPEHVTAAAGPGMHHAEAEVRAIADTWPGGRLLLGEDASVDRLRRALAEPGVVHLAAHGKHEPDNPLFSSVRLADGPLFAHELDSGGSSPDLVVLSSCEVGRASIRAGGEALGMASVLLRTGVGCVVAAVAPLSDEAALRVMTHVHELLRSGVPVADAVAAATAQDAEQTGHVTPLLCLGAPV